MCNFPAGAQEDFKAPYNKEEKLTKTEALVSMTLSRVFNVFYNEGFESLTDAVMSNSSIYTISDLLKILYDLADDKIEQLKDELDLIKIPLDTLSENKIKKEIAKYTRIKECCSWSVDDWEVIENF